MMSYIDSIYMKLSFAAYLLLSVLISACQPATKEPFSLEQVVQANTRALGGAQALDRVQTMVKHSLIVEAPYRDIAVFATDRRGRMRVDLFAEGERVFAESYDGSRAHQWMPGEGQKLASERGAIALSHTAQLPNHIFRLKDLVGNGHQLALVDRERRDDSRFAVLKLTLADGFETYLWVNEESGWVTRVRNTRALHVDIDSEEKLIETRISDFRPVQNIVHPHRIVEVDLHSGNVLAETTVHATELNVDLSERYFTDLVGEVPEAEEP